MSKAPPSLLLLLLLLLRCWRKKRQMRLLTAPWHSPVWTFMGVVLDATYELKDARAKRFLRVRPAPRCDHKKNDNNVVV